MWGGVTGQCVEEKCVHEIWKINIAINMKIVLLVVGAGGQKWKLMDFETDGEKLGRVGGGLASIIHGR